MAKKIYDKRPIITSIVLIILSTILFKLSFDQLSNTSGFVQLIFLVLVMISVGTFIGGFFGLIKVILKKKK